jgi:Flp pilus assembly protein CpaB
VKNDLPDTRVVDDSDENLVAAFKTQVAAHAISPGQTLVREDFVAPGQVQSGMQGTLETDQTKDKSNQLQAVSLTFDDQRSVGGFLQPGDQVNVMFSASVDKDHFFGSGGEGSGSGVKFTSFLMPGLKVLAVGSTTATPASTANSGDGTTPTTQAQTVGRNIITFEVNSRQAQQLVQAQSNGTLYLTLNPTSFKKDSFKDPGEVVEAINLFDKPLPAVDRAAALKASRSGQ